MPFFKLLIWLGWSFIVNIPICELIVVRIPIAWRHFTGAHALNIFLVWLRNSVCIYHNFIPFFAQLQSSEQTDYSTPQNSYPIPSQVLLCQLRSFNSSGRRKRDSCASMPIIMDDALFAELLGFQTDASFPEWSNTH